MEFWATKVDWASYKKKLANGEYLPIDCQLDFDCDDPPDAGSLNAALSDFFPLLLPHLPKKVSEAIMPLVGAIAMCGIDDWEPPNDGPEWLYDNTRDLSDIHVGELYSPTTIKKIVRKFESVSLENMRTALASAWTSKSNDPSDYSYADSEVFGDSEEFLEYLLAWFAPFREAASEGQGIGLGGG